MHSEALGWACFIAYRCDIPKLSTIIHCESCNGYAEVVFFIDLTKHNRGVYQIMSMSFPHHSSFH